MNADDLLFQKLDRIEQGLNCQSKSFLTFDEACAFIGLSKSYLYKLTAKGVVPHFKPRAKLLYFKRDELEQWILKNRVKTQDEIEAEANKYMMNKKVKK